MAERAGGRHAHGLRRLDGQAQPRAVWAVAGRVEGPASTDAADIARIRAIGFSLSVGFGPTRNGTRRVEEVRCGGTAPAVVASPQSCVRSYFLFYNSASRNSSACFAYYRSSLIFYSSSCFAFAMASKCNFSFSASSFCSYFNLSSVYSASNSWIYDCSSLISFSFFCYSATCSSFTSLSFSSNFFLRLTSPP